MLQYLQTLRSIVRDDAMIERKEVIRRYRSLKNFNPDVLKLLCMTQFFMVSKNEKGEVVMV